MTRQLLTAFYPEARFGGFSDVDGTILFYARVRALTSEKSIVLDVGCGRGAAADDDVHVRRELRTLRGYAARVLGIDVDEAARTNPLIDEFRLITAGKWPIESGTIDTLIADWVLEHVEDVAGFFANCRRVLRPGGYLCLRTANAASYVGLASSLVPNPLHRAALRFVRNEKKDEDVFETRYRCNTVWKLRGTLEQSGFDACVYGYDSEPNYLGFSRLAYRLGRFHQRHAPRAFRPALFAFAQRRP